MVHCGKEKQLQFELLLWEMRSGWSSQLQERGSGRPWKRGCTAMKGELSTLGEGSC